VLGRHSHTHPFAALYLPMRARPRCTERAHRTSRDERKVAPRTAHMCSWSSTHRSPVLARSGQGRSASFCAAPDRRQTLSRRSRQVSRHSTELSSVCGCRFGVMGQFDGRPRAVRFGYFASGGATSTQQSQRSKRFAYCFSRKRGRAIPLLETPAAARSSPGREASFRLAGRNVTRSDGGLGSG
jgi:hypothetical protein